MANQPVYIRARDISSMTGFTLAQLRDAEKTTGFPAGLKLGSRTATRFYLRQEVDAWLVERKQKPLPDPK